METYFYDLQNVGQDLKATLLVDYGNGYMGKYEFPRLTVDQETWYTMPDGTKVLAAPGKMQGSRLTFCGVLAKEGNRIWKSDYNS